MKVSLFIAFVLLVPDLCSQNNIGIGTTTPEARLHIRSTGWIKTIFENDAGQPRGYIGTDNNGTVTLAANAFWNGSAWVYPNAGSSMYMLMHRVNNRFEFRVRPDGGSEQTAMVINTAGRVGIGTTAPQQVLSINGGAVIDQNNLNTGTTANMLSFGGFSGEGIGSKRTEGPGRYGLDFYTSSNQRMHIAGNGNIGVGTNIPQALLDIAVGVNRSFRFKNDVIPTLEIASSNNNDALAGIMRLRNAIEIFPSSDGLRAGKLDVRNGAGIPTITLNGSTGIIQANSIQASSVNVTSVIASGGIAGQSVYAPNLPAIAFKETERGGCPTLGQGGNVVLETMQVEFPTSGYAKISGRVHLCSMPGNCGFFLTLQDNTPAQFQQLRQYYFQDFRFEATDILWVGPVQAGNRLYELKMDNTSASASCDVKYLTSNLVIEFFDRKLNN
jgi:hypothetical protein